MLKKVRDSIIKVATLVSLFITIYGTRVLAATTPDEDEVMIPGWMVPPIKELIMKNELAFMLNRPSDDSNNATLASVKPHGPQDDEE